MPNIRQTFRHQQLRNSFTPEQLRVIDEELACIQAARRLALDRGGDPQATSAGSEGERDPNPVVGDQQPVGTVAVVNKEPSTEVGDLPAPDIVSSTPNTTINWDVEHQVITRPTPTSTTTTTGNNTFNSTSIISTGPTTITTTINLTGPTPVTTTTIRTTGTTTVTTDTTPFITVDTDTEEESTKEPDSKHQKTDRSEDTGTV
jgi:hypothetical protein